MTKVQEERVRYSMIVERFNKLLNAGVDVTDYTAADLIKFAPECDSHELEEHMINIAHNMEILEWDYCCIDEEHIELQH